MPLVMVARRSPSLDGPLRAANPLDDIPGGSVTSDLVAAAADPPMVGTGYLTAGLLILAVGGATGGYLAPHTTPMSLKPGISAFAVFYILAQALERAFEVLQLVWPSLGQTTVGSQAVAKHDAAARRDSTLAAAINEASELSAKNAAAAQAAVDQVRLNRTLLAWTINSALAMAGAGWLGLRLIATITSPEWPHYIIDVIVTGLVIGGGTKPLHDLIANLQAAKKKAEDPQSAGK